MLPIALTDSLAARISPGNSGIDLTVEGGEVPCGGENLAYRAAEAFLTRYDVATRIELRLIKRIPSGAGLGGGSSDAAAVLRLLDHLLELAVGEESLRALGLELGADVPFFVSGRPARVSGIGEISSRLPAWPTDPVVVAFRGPGLATSEVYRRFDASLTSPQTASTIPDFPRSPSSRRRNDLELAASQIDPGIERLKEALCARGAYEVGMSGSGSAVFGFFSDRDDALACAEQMRREGDWAEATKVLEHPTPIERLDPNLTW
jgi:4-diphosphocytidyl-2-C-methyl-D-erythritol kinase